jgi:hypothetical protein
MLMNSNLLFDKDMTQSTNAFSSKTEYVAVLCFSVTKHDLIVYRYPESMLQQLIKYMIKFKHQIKFHSNNSCFHGIEHEIITAKNEQQYYRLLCVFLEEHIDLVSMQNDKIHFV